MEEVFVRNAADEDQVREAGGKAKRGRDRELDDFRGIMESISGRRFVFRYINACGVFEDSFTGNNTTFYNEGKRSIGLRLLADINDACPEKYILMIDESKRK